MKLAEKMLAMSFDQNKFFDSIGTDPDLKNKVTTNLNREAKLILYYVYLYDKSNMGDLSKAFSMPNSTTHFIVNKLLKEELIVINRQKKDYRVRELSLSTKGHELVISMIAFLNESINNIFGMIIKNMEEEIKIEFTPSERETIEKFIKLTNGKIERI